LDEAGRAADRGSAAFFVFGFGAAFFGAFFAATRFAAAFFFTAGLRAFGFAAFFAAIESLPTTANAIVREMTRLAKHGDDRM
jgi:hypothetical protein